VELLIARRRASAIKESREVDREVTAIGTDRDTDLIAFPIRFFFFFFVCILMLVI